MEYCVCGHKEKEHKVRWLDPSGGTSIIGCLGCENAWFISGMNKQVLHLFKLDNLKLIEDLAKERKLI